MQNAVRYDDRITFGIVPGFDDLIQLKNLGYKTLIDLREENERFDGIVEKKSLESGLYYINIPVSRNSINVEDVRKFYELIYRKDSPPVYVFSRLGRKPLIFLLLFDTIANNESISRIYREASRLGFRLDGDTCLQKFIYSLFNSSEIHEMIIRIKKLRSDIFEESKPGKRGKPHKYEMSNKGNINFVTDELLRITGEWAANGDPSMLRESLDTLSELIAKSGSA